MAATLFFGLETIRQFHDPEYYSSTIFRGVSTASNTIKWRNDIGPQNAKSLKRLEIFVGAPYIAEVERLPDSAYPPDILHFIKLSEKIWEPDGHEWCQLFDTISQKATGVREMEVWWECAPDCGHFGGGFDVKLVRAVGYIQGLQKLRLSGCYAKEWPGYLRGKTGAEVVERKNEVEMENWEIRHHRRRQGGHRELKP